VTAADPRRFFQSHSRLDTIKLALAFFAIYFIWGSTYLAIRYAVETVPPLLTAAIRHTVAGSFLLGWAMLRGFRPTLANWIAGLVVGSLFFFSQATAYCTGRNNTSPPGWQPC
jgi:drug/metabolite transporter (DMT)-like permease